MQNNSVLVTYQNILFRTTPKIACTMNLQLLLRIVKYPLPLYLRGHVQTIKKTLPPGLDPDSRTCPCCYIPHFADN